MFGGGFLEVGFLLFIGFLLFGPKKLPEIARTLGKGMAELRRASNELRNSLEEEIRNIERPTETPALGPGESTTGAVPKYGDYHSEPTRDESAPRS